MGAFVDVKVKATGELTSVPADWLDSPVFGNKFERVKPKPDPVVATEPAGDPDVQLVAGSEDDRPVRGGGAVTTSPAGASPSTDKEN